MTAILFILLVVLLVIGIINYRLLWMLRLAQTYNKDNKKNSQSIIKVLTYSCGNRKSTWKTGYKI